MSDIFILGAGFSKAISQEMPPMEDLGTEVLARLGEFDPRLLAKLETLGGNIEMWVSYLSQDQPWLPERDNQYNLSRARLICGIIEEVVQERTTRAVALEPPDWLRSLIRAWHHRTATVITLNYDTLIERAAMDLQMANSHERMLPPHIYPPFFAHLSSRTGSAVWGEERLETFSLLKLHGSMNWYYSGRRDFYGETIFYSNVTPFGEGISEDEHRLSAGARDKEVLIVPPAAEKATYFGNEAVRGLWQEANHALQIADRIVMVGYSLPAADLAMQLFLGTIRQNSSAEIQVVDIDRGVLDRYGQLLARILARISHQAASRRQKSSWFQEVDRDANDRAGVPVADCAGRALAGLLAPCVHRAKILRDHHGPW